MRPNCWWIHSSFAYIEPDGTPHPFGGISYSVKVPPCGNGISGTTSGYATDDSGYYYNALGGGKVLAPDGTAIGGLHDVEDTNGNYISHTYNSQNSEWDYTDTAGHLALKVIKGANSIQYKYQDSTGAYQTVTLVLQNYNIKTNFGSPGVAEYTGTATLPSSISFPNGDLYVFAYEPTPGSGGYYTGRVSVISLAYGGSVHYTYGGANDGINCSDGTTVNLTRVTYDATNTATWQFTRALNGSNWITTETKPQMPYDSATNQTVYTFNSSGQEISHQIYQGNYSSGTLLRTVNTTWAANGSPATRTTILENGQQSQVATTYDNYGNLTNKQEYDFGNGAPGQLLRTTTDAFLSTSAYVTRNILNRPTQETISDSSGTVRYRLDTTYDGTTIGPCPTGVA